MDEAPHNWLSIPSKRDIVARLESTAISADAKVILERLLDMAIPVGNRVLEIGRQVLAFAFDIVRNFRGIAFGVAVAVTVSSLIACTPVIGGVLSALLGPLLVAFGLTLGALEDVRNGALRRPLASFDAAMASALRG